MKRAYVDFEASGLGSASYPIEVAWLTAGQARVAGYLIRPAPRWTSWDIAAEELHGLSRKTLVEQGTPAWDVASAMNRALAGCEVHADADIDRFWLARLFEEAPFAPAFEFVVCTPACFASDEAHRSIQSDRQDNPHRALPDTLVLATAHNPETI